MMKKINSKSIISKSELLEDMEDSKLIEEVMDEPEIPFDEFKRKMGIQAEWAKESERSIAHIL